jgi:hypothetical protein
VTRMQRIPPKPIGLPRGPAAMLGAAALLLIACVGCATTAPPQPAALPPSVPVPKAEPPGAQAGPSDAVRTHALAFGAILDSQRADPHSRLVPPPGTAGLQEKMDQMKELFAAQWGIHGRDELLTTLGKLQDGEDGQRQDYWVIRRKLLESKMENYIHVISSGGDGASAFIVATHLGSLHGAALPIMAWDFGRYINLCRWGVELGWITEQEAWDRIIPAARLLQASYASWDDYAADYLLGRNFWNPQSGSDNETLRYIITLLKVPPKGLWSTIDWNESLGTGPALTDILAAKLLDGYRDPDPNSVSFDHVPNDSPVLLMLRTSADPK